VDGGVDTSNAAQLYNAGADVLVAGNAIFKSKNRRKLGIIICRISLY
jgi:ribulose-phosphate 3-epimerase